MYSFLLLTLSVALVVSQNAPSTNLLNFAALHNGFLTNKLQTSVEDLLSGEHHDFLAFHFVPVEVPAFSGSIVFFLEETVNGIDWRLQLRVVSEDVDGIIHVQPYNLTSQSSKHTPGSYDMTKLQDLKLEDLDRREECVTQFSVIEPDVFLGTWPDCNLRVAGQIPPSHISLVTCSALSGFASGLSFERWSRVPYILRAVKRYDLPSSFLGGRTDWSNPCDN